MYRIKIVNPYKSVSYSKETYKGYFKALKKVIELEKTTNRLKFIIVKAV